MRIEWLDLEKEHMFPIPTVVCIGYFDGIHRGHQKLIEKTNELAEKYSCESAMITFDPDPKEALSGNKAYHITPLNQRINLAVQFGIQNIFIIRFTQEMASLSPADFTNKILGRCNIRALVCGYDFRFGVRGSGDADMLKELLSVEVAVVPPVMDEKGRISSTRIITLINDGEVEEADRLLGYPFEIVGFVKHGRAKGRTIGFPTANVAVTDDYILPLPGVYAGYAICDGVRYKAMINLGHNPTFNYTSRLSLEVHLLDFDGDIYGYRLRVQFMKYIREEIAFKVADNLKMQLERDVRTVRELLK